MNYTSSTYFSLSASRRSIDEIYATFRHHWNSLWEEERKVNEAIDEWSIGLINQIRDYTSRQKALVSQVFKSYQKHLDEMRDQFVQSGYVYERKGDTMELNRLVEKCKTLEIELVKFNFHSENIEFIDLKPIEPSELIAQDMLDQNQIVDQNFGNRSNDRSAFESRHASEDSKFNSYSTSTFVTTDQTRYVLYNILFNYRNNFNLILQLLTDGPVNKR